MKEIIRCVLVFFLSVQLSLGGLAVEGCAARSAQSSAPEPDTGSSIFHGRSNGLASTLAKVVRGSSRLSADTKIHIGANRSAVSRAEHEFFYKWPEFTRFSNAALSRRNKLEPVTWRSPFFLKSEKSLVTVSRDAPIMAAISSCVRVNVARSGFLLSR